jgi:hypothetical protein
MAAVVVRISQFSPFNRALYDRAYGITRQPRFADIAVETYATENVPFFYVRDFQPVLQR